MKFRKWAIAIIVALGCCLPSLSANAQAGSGLQQQLKTKHLTIYSKEPRSSMKVGTYLEWFILYLDKTWYQVPSSMQIKVYVFPTEPEFNAYIQENFDYKGKLMGFYNNGCFYTSAQTGLGTLSHEFMHAVFHYTHAKLDPWAFEGIPAFFEKMYGYVDRGNAYFITGFQNPWRIREISSNLKHLTLEEIINNSNDQSEQRLVAVFLYKQGYLKKFLDLSRTGSKGTYGTCLEAAFCRNIESLEPYWRKYLSEIIAKEKDINLIPGSQFFATKAEYDEFMTARGKILKDFM